MTRVGVGKVAISRTHLAINQDVKALEIVDERVTTSYLFYFLKQAAPQLEKNATGATVKGITLNEVKKLEIPIPPLAEQRRIVEILDRAENIKRLRQQVIETTQRIAPALFYEMFGNPVTNEKGWEAATLGELVKDIRNGFNPKKEQFGTGTPFVTVNNLYDGAEIDLGSCVNVEANDEVIEKYKLERGDLCFVRSSVKRLGIGQCSCFFSDKTAIFGGFVIRVQISPQILAPLFAAHMLLYPSIRHFIVEQSGTGTITNISQPSLKRTPLIVPPLTLQNEFIARLVSVNKTSAIQSVANKQNEQLYSALSAQLLAA